MISDADWNNTLYGYPFKTEPWPHQLEEFTLYKDEPGRALLWQMRTGKTKAIIDLACYLYTTKKINRVLILAPNGVHIQWIYQELAKHMWPSVPYIGFAYVASNRWNDEHIANVETVCNERTGLSFLAINNESLFVADIMGTIARFMKKKDVLGVFDESHDFRVPGSKRTKIARGIRKHLKYSRILTGSPVDNSPLHAYSQFELVEPGCLGYDTYQSFVDNFAKYREEKTAGGRTYKVLNEFINTDQLTKAIAQHASLVLRKDVVGLPPLVHSQRTFEIGETLAQAYKAIKEEFYLELNSGKIIDAVSGGARLIKLQQILSGFCIDDKHEAHSLVNEDMNPRLQALAEELEGWPTSKVIIWCNFREDIRKVGSFITKKLGRPYVEYYGPISPELRLKNLQTFQNDPLCPTFIGQPAAGGRGLDLSAAEAIIWYSHTPNLIIRNQANERGTKKDGRPVYVIDLVARNSVDEYWLELLKDKHDLSELIARSGLREVLLDILSKDKI